MFFWGKNFLIEKTAKPCDIVGSEISV